jgi:ABC-type antimicrobial peptide transport system permease subunit
MVVTLALGIAATTAIFSVVYGVLLRPLPWPDPDRLVVIHGVEPDRLQRPSGATSWNTGLLTWQEWEGLQATGVFQHVAAWWSQRFLHYSDAGVDSIGGMYASANLLATLGPPPLLGRTFARASDRTMNQNEVLISARMWRRHFGASEDVLGQTIHLSPGGADRAEPYRIIGVLPASLRVQDDEPDVVLSIGNMSFVLGFGRAQLRILARLAPDRTLEVARAAATAQIGPSTASPERTARVNLLNVEEVGGASRPLWLIFGGAALLLLISCANVAGLLLGEVRARRHEVAVRTSLGSGFGRILRQLTVEQMLLCLVASATGVMLAVWLLPVLVALAPDRLPRLDMVSIDARLAGLAFVAGTLTALVFTVVPTWSLARTPAAMVLAEGSRDGAGGRHAGQRIIVALEVALALVLVVGAALFGETIARLAQRPLGFTPDRLIVVSLSEAGRAYTADEWASVLDTRAGNRPSRMEPRDADGRVLTREDIQQLIVNRAASTARRDAVTQALMAIPGVSSVAGVTQAPFVGTPVDTQVGVPGAGEVAMASRVTVTGAYFTTLDVPIVEGQAFALNLGPRVQQAVLSQGLARRLFGGGSPVGRQVAIGAAQTALYDVVGVAGDTKYTNLTEDDRLLVYTVNPSGQLIGERAVAQYLARTAVDPSALLPRVREALRHTNPPLAVTAVTTMEERVAGTVAESRFRALLATIFGSAALLLSGIGLFAVTSRRVEERRREIGVRVALGARGLDIRRLVLGDAARTWLVGLALGLPAAVLMSEGTQAFLFGVSATSPRVYVVAAAVLATAAVVAVIIPVRRAARVDVAALLKQ